MSRRVASKNVTKIKFIKAEKFENHDVYFDAQFNVKNAKITYFTSKEKGKKIIDYLQENDYGISKSKLSNALKMHPNTISKYLKMLEQFNIIIKKKNLKKNYIFFK